MTAGAGMEVELKYRVATPGAADGLLARDELAGFRATAPARSIPHEDRYVDTTDAALARAGFGGRLRQAGDGFLVSLKSLARAPGTGAAYHREELEGPADTALRPADWPTSAARTRLLELTGDTPLVDVVTVRQLRRKREYRRDATLLEVSLDEVDVVVNGEVIERFEELEVEVLEGDGGALEEIAPLIEAIDGVEPVAASKLERALEAAHRAGDGKGGLADLVLEAARAAGPGQPGKASNGSAPMPDAAALVPPPAPERARSKRTGGDTKRGKRDAAARATATPAAPDGAPKASAIDAAPSPSVTPDASTATPAGTPPDALTLPPLRVGKSPGVLAEDHLAEAGRKVLRFHVARMLDVEPGTRAGEDPEFLHKMRVATRRQRAAWRVFGDAYDPRRTKKHRDRLRDVARRLGAVRDLDVLIENGEAYQRAQAETEAAAFEPLLAAWRDERSDARELLIKELDSSRHLAWLDDYRDFVVSEGRGAVAVSATVPHRVRDTMPSRIWAAYEGARAYESVLRWADVPTLHELRIAGKWLRYTLEFVREALGPDATPLIEKVVALQDHLGLLNDADVAANLARRFLVEHAGDVTDLEGAAIGRYLVDRERELARLRRTVGPVWRGVASLAFRRQLGRVTAGL